MPHVICGWLAQLICIPGELFHRQQLKIFGMSGDERAMRYYTFIWEQSKLYRRAPGAIWKYKTELLCCVFARSDPFFVPNNPRGTQIKLYAPYCMRQSIGEKGRCAHASAPEGRNLDRLCPGRIHEPGALSIKMRPRGGFERKGNLKLLRRLACIFSRAI
jgi:hypothetical protein